MTPKPLFVARLAGSQSEMGTQHGALAAADAVRLFEFYRTMPERALAGDMGRASRFVVRSVATAWQARLAAQRPPELAARTRAFVDAVLAHSPDARHDPRIARLTLATMDSLQNCVALAARAGLGPFGQTAQARARVAAAPACSTLIAWGSATEDGELVFGRNFDFPGVGVWDAAPAFLVCAPDRGQRYAFFTTRGADAPVVTVVNEAGLVLAPHTRWHRGVTWGGAMIVDVVHEIARRAESLDDAIRIARERPASSSWGIAVGSAREKSAIVLELAGALVDVVRPRPGAEYLTCTNRYRTPALQAGEVAGSPAWAIHANRREHRLRTLAEGRDRPLAPRDVARFLGDRHDPEAPGTKRRLGGILAQPTNVHCVVVQPAARRAWVGVDHAPVCEGAWAELAWQWDGPTGGWDQQGPGIATTLVDDFVAPHDPATRHVHEAVRAFERSHDVAAARASIERAIGIDPDDPSLRLAAAWLAIEGGAVDRAVVHVHAGLVLETERYRRGQLLAAGIRAAATTEPDQARRWRDDLARLPGDGLDELRASIDRPAHRLRTNLMMVDAT
ncbi:MAG TPA: C45 family autoproteolytic acyltransferase/hydrolase [Kofleriaceae bacterium]|nr:C45 family autoproteolytic acyltransferase/hydrolase [Kofleriaceae bacterium]